MWNQKVIVDQVTIGGLGTLFSGTVNEVADRIEEYVDYTDVDGFNFAYTSLPKTFEDIANKLIPELRRRGLSIGAEAQEEIAEIQPSFRYQLFGTNDLDITHPAHDLKWRSDESKEEFEKRLPEALEKLHNTN